MPCPLPITPFLLNLTQLLLQPLVFILVTVLRQSKVDVFGILLHDDVNHCIPTASVKSHLKLRTVMERLRLMVLLSCWNRKVKFGKNSEILGIHFCANAKLRTQLIINTCKLPKNHLFSLVGMTSMHEKLKFYDVTLPKILGSLF